MRGLVADSCEPFTPADVRPAGMVAALLARLDAARAAQDLLLATFGDSGVETIDALRR